MTDIHPLSSAPLSADKIVRADKPQAATEAATQAATEAASDFEALFIAQMLEYSGLSKAFTLNGGEGVEAFSRFMIEQLAQDMTAQGGFGLTEAITEDLLARQASTPPRKD